MDLVVLVAELSQKKKKSLNEIDEELLHRGYSSAEIEQALFWMSSQWKPLDAVELGSFDRPVFRVLSPWEALNVDAEAHGYLLRLQNLGIINPDQFEKIMSRILPFGPDKIQLSEIKALAGMVVFNLQGDSLDDDGFQVVDDDIQLT